MQIPEKLNLDPALWNPKSIILRFNREKAFSLVKTILNAANVSFRDNKDALESLELQLNKKKDAEPLRKLIRFLSKADNVQGSLALKKQEFLAALKFGFKFERHQIKSIFKALGLDDKDVKTVKSFIEPDCKLIGAETLGDAEKQKLREQGKKLLSMPSSILDKSAESFLLEKSHKNFIENSLKKINQTLEELGNPSFVDSGIEEQNLLSMDSKSQNLHLSVKGLLEIRDYFNALLDDAIDKRQILSKKEKEFFDSITDRKGAYKNNGKDSNTHKKRRLREKYYNIFQLKVIWSPEVKRLTDNLFKVIGLD